jgi:putative Mg2+ transporter-C (MgtC) family protein
MPTTETLLIRLLLALVLGGAIGIEREYRDKSAGFRTLTLICVGSCLFTLVSMLLTNGTTDRIASNIVTGIGFLGAGVIFKSDKGVNGLTTAASVWAVAAIGMAAASGLYLISVVTCLVMLIILVAFNPIEEWLDRLNKERVYRIVTPYQPEIIDKYEELMKKSRLSYRRSKRMRKGEDILLEWKVRGSRKAHNFFTEEILRDNTVGEFEF